MKDSNKNIVIYILLLLLIIVPIFGHLNSLAVRVWDESRLAVNAYEMYKNHNFLVTYYEGSPDMWNTKPPLMIWLQVFFMKIIGVNTLAVRLPSALAALGTILALFVFLKKYLKKHWIGIISVLVLITSQGYVGLHASRTGDYDTLLTLFTTLYCLLFFTYIETKRTKYLYLFFLFATLSVLTKSISGLLLFPAVALYALIQKQVIDLLKNKHFYLGLVSFVAIITGYYLLREHYNPGYIEAVQNNELGGRFNSVIENHKHGFWFYYNNIIGDHFSFWHLFIPAGIAIGMSSKETRIGKITLFSSLIILSYFLVISLAQTKISWYDVPMYPFLSILVAIFIDFVMDYLKNNSRIEEKLKYNPLPYLFLFFIVVNPYQNILATTYIPKELDNTQKFNLSYYFKDVLKSKTELEATYFVYEGYDAHILFYTHALSEKGMDISVKDYHHLQAGDKVVLGQDVLDQYLNDQYETKLIQHYKETKTYLILEKK